MSASFVASASANSGASSTLSVSVAVPAAAAVGDVLVYSATSERAAIPTVTAPVTAVNVGRSDGSTNLAHTTGWVRLAAGDLGGNIVLTQAAARLSALAVAVYRGVNDPQITAATLGSNNSLGSTLTCPAVTPVAANSMIVGVIGFAPVTSPRNGRTFSATAPYTERVEVGSSGTGADGYSIIGDQLLSGGAGASTAGLVETESGTNSQYYASSYVLAPASANPTISHADIASTQVSNAAASTPGSGGTLAFTATKISGPTLAVAQPKPGYFVFGKDSTADAVYTITATESPSGGTSSYNVTITHTNSTSTAGQVKILIFDGTTWN